MKIILMVNDNTAEQLGEVGLEQWWQENQVSPLLMVMSQEGSGREWPAEIVVDKCLPFPGSEAATHTSGPDPGAMEALMQGPLCLYPRYRRVTMYGKQVELKNKEFELLLYLVSHPAEIFSKEQLYRQLWGTPGGDTATVTVHISRLRKKLEKDPANPLYIQTVWGAGYRFQP